MRSSNQMACLRLCGLPIKKPVSDYVVFNQTVRLKIIWFSNQMACLRLYRLLKKWPNSDYVVFQLNGLSQIMLLCLFDLILCVPSTIFQLNRDGFSWFEPVLSLDKCVLLKDHNTVTPVRLEPSVSSQTLYHCQIMLSSKEMVRLRLCGLPIKWPVSDYVDFLRNGQTQIMWSSN